MTKVRTLLGLVLTLLLAFPAAGESDWRSEAVKKLPQSGEMHLALYNDGERDGFMRLGWIKRDEAIEIYDRSMLPSGELYESQEAVVSAANLTPQRVSVRFHQGSAIGYTDVEFADGSAKGERRFVQPGQEDRISSVEINELPFGLTLRIMSFVLPLGLSQEPGASLNYSWYAPLGNTLQAVSLTAREGRQVETPAGKFDTVLFELRGGASENDIYVTRGDKPSIVRIDVLAQPFQFLALPAPAAEMQ